MPVYELPEEIAFPDPAHAEPDGLLAVGGDLNPDRVLFAYSIGVFPWPMSGWPLAWFCPDPRMVLYPNNIRRSRSMRKAMRSGRFTVSADTAFDAVIEACSVVPREGQSGTWITAEMKAAYSELHRRGFAHSVEVWSDRELVGGLYGVSVGAAFCGESMFHRESNASKVAFVCLAAAAQAWGLHFIDCQIHTDHLESLGATEIPRERFLQEHRESQRENTRRGSWSAPFLDAVTDTGWLGGQSANE